MTAWEQATTVLEDAAGTVIAVGILFAFLWRIVKPHVREYVRNQTAALEQLEGDQHPHTLAGRAKRSAEETSAVVRKVDGLVVTLGDVVTRLAVLEEAQLTERVRILEVSDDQQDRRLGILEGAVLEQLAGELRDQRAATRGEVND